MVLSKRQLPRSWVVIPKWLWEDARTASTCRDLDRNLLLSGVPAAARTWGLKAALSNPAPRPAREPLRGGIALVLP